MSKNKSKFHFFYNEKQNGSVQFFIADCSVNDVFSQIPNKLKITNIKFLASDYRRNYVNEEDLIKENTFNDILMFLQENEDYSIDDMELNLENKLEVSAHDNNDINIIFFKNINYKKIISNIFNKLGLDENIIFPELKKNKNKYLIFEKSGKLVEKFDGFEEYLESEMV